MSEQTIEDPAAVMAAEIAGVNLEASSADETSKELNSPDDVQADVTGEAAEKPVDTPPSEQGLDSDISDDALLEELGNQLGTTPEETEEKVKRDLAASSKEARRLNEVLKGVQETLTAQGIELSLTEEGSFLGLRRTGEQGSAVFPEPPQVTSHLQDQLIEDAQGAVNQIWADAQKAAEAAFALPAPDLESVSNPPSLETLESSKQAVKDAKDKFGNVLYPNFDRLEPVVSNMVEQLPASLREAYNEAPGMMLRLLHDSAENARVRLIEGVKAEQAKKQKEQVEAEANASLYPEGDAVVNVGDGSPRAAAAAMAEHIAKSVM